jgi:hypothetical protein
MPPSDFKPTGEGKANHLQVIINEALNADLWNYIYCTLNRIAFAIKLYDECT